MPRPFASAVSVLVFVLGCSGSNAGSLSDADGGMGGAEDSEGNPASGTGGKNTTGGTSATGGKNTTGGMDSTGGMDTAGGANTGGDSGGEVVVVTEDGANVTVRPGSGEPIDFVVPGTAAGKTISLTPGASEDIGWAKDTFEQVVNLEPSGTTFNPPIIVRPQGKSVLLLTFETSTQRGPAEGLAYNETEKGFELPHFSTLVSIPNETSCGTGSGWQVTEDSAEWS